GAAGLGGMSGSQLPTISADGRFVSYQSDAPNLDPDDTDGSFDVYLRDTQAHATTLISRADGAAGSKSNGDSFNGGISADGKFIGFTSSGSNLDPDDTDAFRDVFMRETGPPDGPDTTAPAFDLVGKKTLKVKSKLKKLKVKASTDEACTVAATGKIKVPKAKKKLKLKPATAELVPGEAKLKLKPSRKAKRAVTRALAAGKKSKAKIKATCTDAAGNAASDKQKVKIKRKRK
ncbi:MAG TPA: hypothetical protein VD766_14100, partial [Solirubrobacterales bacterium]|nr:hypothetical protein [Solirubrobacterales bacterium]